jgi:hypothetical protein
LLGGGGGGGVGMCFVTAFLREKQVKKRLVLNEEVNIDKIIF